MAGIGLRLTPHGRLVVENQDDAPGIDRATSIRLTEAFAQGTGHGLVRLGAAEVGQTLPPVFVWWRDCAATSARSACTRPARAEDGRKPPSVPAPTAAELSSLVLTAPMMAGPVSDPRYPGRVVGRDGRAFATSAPTRSRLQAF
jgi:non-specific serine/threonine protein kinase